MDIELALEQRTKVEEFRRRHQIGLLVLLFTDLVGSTKLKEELGDRPAVALIQRHHALVREALRHFTEGEEINTAGDSFFIVFAKPSDAVEFSLLLQNRLRALSKESPRPLLDRIGIHIGEVMVEERPGSGRPVDLYGLQVDICARVMSLAEGDQILMTRSAFDNARQVLKGQDIQGINPLIELQWLNHGPYVLKGVDEPLEICEVGEPGQAVLEPPADSDKVHRYLSPDAEAVLGWRPALEQMVPGTQWILEEKLGEGGFGEVWVGRHQVVKERRVFKFCFRPDRVRALKREVTLFRLLKERVGEPRNIVRLHEVFFDEPPFYIEMEYIEGRDLRVWGAEHGGIGAIPLETRLEIVAQVADGLQAAHDAGVIHRDVKPSNILISDWRFEDCDCPERYRPSPRVPMPSGRTVDKSKIANLKLTTKLTDFGIGQAQSPEVFAGLTKLGFTQTVLSPGSSAQTGTQLYMSPEVMVGETASNRSDIYSLGVVLYQMLAGDFSRPLTIDWAKKISDPLLREDLARCFAGDPQERFASASELAANLRSLPKRREAFEREEAEQTAREQAAYRRRVMFGKARTVFVIAWLTTFALIAWREARIAKRAVARAEASELQARQNHYVAEPLLTQQASEVAHDLAATTRDHRVLRPIISEF